MFVEPTIFADVDSSMRIEQEEVLGPSGMVFGLAVGVWTSSIKRAIALPDCLKAETMGEHLLVGQLSVASSQL